MTKPWLSVITPIYNGGKYLAYALESILVQGDGDIECVVVDGESTDSTRSILDSYHDRLPITIYEKKRDDNWVTKTNFALSVAKGEYACFLHHDDYWLNGRLNIMRGLTEKFPEAVLLLHPSNFLDDRGRKVGLWSCPLPAYPTIVTPSLMLERLLVQNFISILGPIFKREVAVRVGGLDVSLWYTADWDFWLKIAAQGEAVYYPKPLAGFRIHPSSQTMIRSSHLADFQEQLERVAMKHFALWRAPVSLKRRVRRLALFSTKVNTALAGRIHGERIDLFDILFSFLLLGPLGWYVYLRDSRIWERASARLRARLATKSL